MLTLQNMLHSQTNAGEDNYQTVPIFPLFVMLKLFLTSDNIDYELKPCLWCEQM